jgi:assimilatory nitrate reductase catalytic subunit
VVEPYRAAWYGFAVMRDRPAHIAADTWAAARTRGGWRLELAGLALPDDWGALARALLAAGEGAPIDMLSYVDAAGGQHRFAAFAGSRLAGLLFVSKGPVGVARQWACDQLEAEHETAAARLGLLAGRGGADAPDRGAVVCACFEVGQLQIATAVAQGCVTVDAVGASLKAGTNCGSCRAEIGRIIHAGRYQKAG